MWITYPQMINKSTGKIKGIRPSWMLTGLSCPFRLRRGINPSMVISSILNVLFPPVCLSCGSWGTHLCHRCRERFPFVDRDGCLYCDKITRAGMTCARCLRPEGIDGLVSMVYYSPEVRNAVREVKYSLVSSGIRSLMRSLRPEIVAKTAPWWRFAPTPRLQPIPLHKDRLRTRGFNQAELLARELRIVTGAPYADPPLLVRRRPTFQQARSADRRERARNLQGAFVVPRGVSLTGRAVVLVDDVITTGSTVKEAARTLKRAGAHQVLVWCFARV
jgi:ComF family protein